MKKIKIGVAVLFGVVGIYFIISYGIFLVKKPIIDKQLEEPLNEKIIEDKSELDNSIVSENNVMKKDELVEIQSVFEKNNDYNQIIDHEDVVISNQSIDDQLEKKDNDVVPENSCILHQVYSFVDMPIVDDYTIDNQTYKTLQILIGSNIDQFVTLILQSNNDLITAQICKSCTLFAFFKKIQHKKPLTVDEIKALQKMLANLYKFVQVTQNLSEEKLLQTEQYIALENLNRSGDFKQDIEQQVQKNIMIGALQKLLHMSGNGH